MAESLHLMQVGIANAAGALDGAREGLRDAQERLEQTVAQQAAIAALGRRALEGGDPADLMRETVAMLCRVLRVQSAAVLKRAMTATPLVRAHEGAQAEDAAGALRRGHDHRDPRRDHRLRHARDRAGARGAR